MVKNILLIRGLSREQSHWGTFPNHLESHSGLKAHCIDLPGAGIYFKEKAPLTIQENTKFLRNEWKELKEKHPGDWFILGVSLGGMICLDWAISHNEDAKGFFVLNSSVKGMNSVFKRMSPFAMKLILKAFFANPETHEKIIYELTSVNDPESYEAKKIIAEWICHKEKRPMARLNFFRQVVAAASYKLHPKPLRNLTFLAGKQDRLCHYSNSIKLAKLMNCSYELCESGAGHDFALDRPDFIISHLKRAMCSLNKPPAINDSTSSISSFV